MFESFDLQQVKLLVSLSERAVYDTRSKCHDQLTRLYYQRQELHTNRKKRLAFRSQAKRSVEGMCGSLGVVQPVQDQNSRGSV